MSSNEVFSSCILNQDNGFLFPLSKAQKGPFGIFPSLCLFLEGEFAVCGQNNNQKEKIQQSFPGKGPAGRTPKSELLTSGLNVPNASMEFSSAFCCNSFSAKLLTHFLIF